MTTPPQKLTMTKVARMVLDLLRPADRRLLAWVLIASFVTAGFELIGVASILPFMAIVVDPDALTRYPALARMAAAVGADTWRDTILWAAAGTGAAVTLGNAARMASSWLQWQSDARIRHRLATDLQRAFLQAPYAFHVKRDAPSLMKTIGHDLGSVTGNMISSLLTIASRGLMVLALLGLLAIQSPAVALTAIATLGGAYALVYRATRRRQARLGEQAGRASYQLQRTALEAFGGIKELTVLERRSALSDRFAAADRQLTEISISRKISEAAPRYLLETLTFVCILLVTVLLVLRTEAGSATAIPTLALYAFVGYRLMPGLQQLYGAAIALRFGVPALRSLHADWQATAAGDGTRVVMSARPPMSFTRTIALRDVTFSYAGAARPAVRDITLDIRRGESLGLFGRTGSGKSTLADLLLGLFEPDRGTITIDDAPLTPATAAGWRRRIGYVPQHIFLANASVSENIAFGLPPGEIDQAAVTEAARLAQIDAFITGLPRGYDTRVGERGVRLSGGERQRIGIARALYGRPAVLIFDEATSALDGLTEDAVMEAVRRLGGDRTVILIAHRLRTLDACDRLVRLEAGRITAIGTPADLAAGTGAFRGVRTVP